MFDLKNKDHVDFLCKKNQHLSLKLSLVSKPFLKSFAHYCKSFVLLLSLKRRQVHSIFDVFRFNCKCRFLISAGQFCGFNNFVLLGLFRFHIFDHNYFIRMIIAVDTRCLLRKCFKCGIAVMPIDDHMLFFDNIGLKNIKQFLMVSAISLDLSSLCSWGAMKLTQLVHNLIRSVIYPSLLRIFDNRTFSSPTSYNRLGSIAIILKRAQMIRAFIDLYIFILILNVILSYIPQARGHEVALKIKIAVIAVPGS